MPGSFSSEYPLVDSPLRIRGKVLRSRVYLPAHQPGLAEGGIPRQRYIAYHRERARAGLGMQITGATPVLRSEVWANGLSIMNVDDSIIPGYRRLAEAVHDEGGLMLAQLAHVGAMETSGDHIVSASWTVSQLTQRIARMATFDELQQITELYRACARRCREGALDGVEVTMAHGMLLASFLSPVMNNREDEYGGDLDGRTRFPREVLRAVRQVCGDEMIVGIRIPGDELIDGGLDAEMAVETARRLEATGDADYISVTAGNNTEKLARVDHWPPTPAPVATFRHLSRAVKGAVQVPVATVGRVTTIELAEGILKQGDADLVGMVRAHIADPLLLPKSRAGKRTSVRPCVGANVCVNALLDHRSLRCLVNPEIGRDLRLLENQVGDGRLAVVIGAGPAGLEASRRLSLRGYSVRLYEKDQEVGGQVRKWANTPSRREFFKALNWWRAELDRLQVDLRLQQTVEPEELREFHPALVLLATGSRPVAPNQASSVPQLSPYEALEVPAGDHIVVRDEVGRLGAMLIAEQLKQHWKRVTLVTSALHPGEGEGITTVYTLLRALGQQGVAICDRAKVSSIDGATVHLRSIFDEARPAIENVQAVVGVLGSISETSLLGPLDRAGMQAVLIGDARLPRDMVDAVEDAANTVWTLGSNTSVASP